MPRRHALGRRTLLRVAAMGLGAAGLDAGLAACSETAPGESALEPSEVSANGDVAYHQGALPLIVCAPHGGRLKPKGMPDRPEGNLRADMNTAELAELVVGALTAKLGAAPHLVVSRLHRSKLDPNRPIESGAAGQPRAEEAWQAYHRFIERACEAATKSKGAGLLLDIHGHGHDVPRVELGYLVNRVELALDDAVVDTLAEQSSIAALVRRTGRPLSTWLRGPSSLGAALQARGYRAVPSPEEPSPGKEPFFDGGYTVQRHGSRDAGSIDAVQIEAHLDGVRDTRPHRMAFALALASAVTDTLYPHYG